MASSTSGGVTAPPQRVHAHISACAFTRSPRGNHWLSMRVRLGKQPASPAPNRKRIASIELKLHAAPVSAVKNDHASTRRERIFFTPSLSPISPIGISNSA